MLVFRKLVFCSARRGSSPCHPQHPFELFTEEVSLLEVQTHAALLHLHAHGGQHQLGDDGQHRAFLEVGARKQDVLHVMEQDVCGGMEVEAELVGGEAAAGHPVGVQIGFQLLDHQLYIASSAIASLVNELPRAVEVGDDEPHVRSEHADLDFDNHALCVLPAASLVHELVVSLGRPSRAAEHLHVVGHPLLDLPVEHAVPCQAGDEADAPLLHRPVHELVAAEVAVAPDDDFGVLPALAQAGDQPDEQPGNVDGLVAAPRTQHGQYELAAQPLENEQRHVAILVVVIVEQGELLTAVGVRVGVVAVEDDGLRGLLVGGDEMLNEHFADVPQLFRRQGVLHTAHGRLGCQCRGLGVASGEQFHHLVIAQGVAVVGILVPAGYLRHALEEHLLFGVLDQPLFACVIYHGGDFPYDAAFSLRFPEHCQPTARGDGRVVEGCRDFPCSDAGESENFSLAAA